MTINVGGLPSEYLFLLFTRILALLFSTPIFGHRSVPVWTRIGLAGLLAYLLNHVAAVGSASPSILLGQFLLLAAHEVMLGLLVGFVATLAMAGLEMAGNVISAMLGLNMATQLNPSTEEPVAVAGQFYTLLISLIFLGLNGHHWLIMAIAQTLRFAPVGTFQPDLQMLADLISLSASIFVVALRIALPVFGAVLLTDVALTLVARAVPQINVFMIGLPLRALVTLLAMAATLPFLGSAMAHLLQEGITHLADFLTVTKSQ